MCLTYCIYLCMFVQNGAIAKSIVVTNETEIIKKFQDNVFFFYFVSIMLKPDATN